jgi:hypothetical protein
MSLIFNCTVESSPARIRFRWEGEFTLPSASSVRVEESDVTPVGGAKTQLGGWTAKLSKVPAPGPPKAKHAYDVELMPGPKAMYKPTPGDSLELTFAFGNPPKTGRGEARAIVDYQSDPVVGAINAARDAFTAQASGARQDLTSQSTALTNQAAALTNQTAALANEAAAINQQAAAVGKGLDETRETIAKDLRLLTGYPFQITDGLGPSPTVPGAGGVSSGTVIVDAQMRALLGRSLGKGGVTATLAALDRSFQLVDQDGIQTWVPQPTYAVQSDIGAGVTGEQASLARLVASVTTEITPLVANLGPLILEANVPLDKVAAAQGIFANALPLLNAELGRDGGPRISRARVVLGDAALQLLTLGILLGMYDPATQVPAFLTDSTNPWRPGPVDQWPQPVRTNVVTGDDEDNFTNFLIAFGRLQIVVHQFNALYGPVKVRLPTDRGTLIVLLQRALDAAGEAADAVLAALDSVNLGQDERELIYLTPGDVTSDSVEGALDLAAQFHLEAGALLQDSGTLGATAILSRAMDIRGTVVQLSLNGNSLPQGWPLGLAHPRVQVAIDILDGALQEVIDNSKALAP